MNNSTIRILMNLQSSLIWIMHGKKTKDVLLPCLCMHNAVTMMLPVHDDGGWVSQVGNHVWCSSSSPNFTHFFEEPPCQPTRWPLLPSMVHCARWHACLLSTCGAVKGRRSWWNTLLSLISTKRPSTFARCTSLFIATSIQGCARWSYSMPTFAIRQSKRWIGIQWHPHPIWKILFSPISHAFSPKWC